MRLDEYIKLVLANTPPGEIKFEINLDEQVKVVSYVTGNVIRFTVIKEESTTDS